MFFKLNFFLKRMYWFIFRPKTAGVKCILKNEDKILMIRKTFGSDKWVFPGGAIKKDEQPVDAVRREIVEDLGIDIIEVRELGLFTQNIRYRKETMYCFSGKIQAWVLKYDTQKIREVGWFSENELPHLTPVSESVFKLYKQIVSS
jgi:ADP-ribose pyrophosphatase YjhB (NUDIX family)